ncbi:MAG: hypothetical protein PHU21_08950 [Elusimicrobia bacterium]|nr:hypothetical protein [Elusimicrobiota bacterium]
MNPEEKKAEPKMDPNSLYREEVFTDHHAGTIRRLAPVKADGSPDPGRKAVFIGEAQLLTSAGALPLSFEIPAESLGDAARKYGEGVKQAYEDALAEFQELRRRASSGLVIPGAGASGLEGLGGGGLPPGGLPGGGKLKL